MGAGGVGSRMLGGWERGLRVDSKLLASATTLVHYFCPPSPAVTVVLFLTRRGIFCRAVPTSAPVPMRNRWRSWAEVSNTRPERRRLSPRGSN